MPQRRLPALPPQINEKLKKSSNTRGAAESEPYQNRVKRNNPVLIPWKYWDQCKEPDNDSTSYENGFIVLLEPSWYFDTLDADDRLAAEGVKVGKNALLLFRKRSDWIAYGPSSGTLPNGMPFQAASSRSAPLGGVYFARVHATTASEGGKIVHGFNSRSSRGAGIRVFEYASSSTLKVTELQLESLIWSCHDADRVMAEAGMAANNVNIRRNAVLGNSSAAGLLDRDRLRRLRAINSEGQLICPLCLIKISTGEFLRRIEQAEGRTVFDLTTTEITLFHVQELRIGKLQHKPYNLGWGHQHCNTVVKDDGIPRTVDWMKTVIDNQRLAETELGEVTDSVEKAVDG